jgi:hypothetical protein
VYYWKVGDTWHLKDLTNPGQPFEYTQSAKAGEEEPPRTLLAQLNDPDHFPAGILNYQIPGRYGSYVEVTDHLTWKKFFAYVSLGLAVAGAVLSAAATAGITAAAVPAVYAFTASGIAMALSSGIDLVEHLQRGNLDMTTAILDMAQIVRWPQAPSSRLRPPPPRARAGPAPGRVRPWSRSACMCPPPSRPPAPTWSPSWRSPPRRSSKWRPFTTTSR